MFMGYCIGLGVGLHALLAFTFFARPGRWLFPSLSASQGMLLYAYLSILFLAAVAGAGTLIGRLIERRIARRTTLPRVPDRLAKIGDTPR